MTVKFRRKGTPPKWAFLLILGSATLWATSVRCQQIAPGMTITTLFPENFSDTTQCLKILKISISETAQVQPPRLVVSEKWLTFSSCFVSGWTSDFVIFGAPYVLLRSDFDIKC